MLDRSRRLQDMVESGVSNVISIGYGTVRLKKMYMPRRYRSLPWLTGHFTLRPTSVTKAGNGGRIPRRPIVRSSKPLTAKCRSRTISALTR